VSPLLQELVTSLQGARETADGAARSLAGEQVAAPMDVPGADAGGMSGALPAPDLGSDLDSDSSDGFDATDAAAGGDLGLGRDKR
jgi:hypothetical protein